MFLKVAVFGRGRGFRVFASIGLPRGFLYNILKGCGDVSHGWVRPVSPQRFPQPQAPSSNPQPEFPSQRSEPLRHVAALLLFPFQFLLMLAFFCCFHTAVRTQQTTRQQIPG